MAGKKPTASVPAAASSPEVEQLSQAIYVALVVRRGGQFNPSVLAAEAREFAAAYFASADAAPASEVPETEAPAAE